MVKNKIEYYYLTINNGITTIKVGDKYIPIVGVFLSDNDMHEVLSGKKIEDNTGNKFKSVLFYTKADLVHKREVKSLEKILLTLSLEEKILYQKELEKIEQDLKDLLFVNSSYGLGEKMTRRLIVNSKKNM